MNKGKKWFLILCALVLAFSALAGCGNDQGATGQQSNSDQQKETGDQGGSEPFKLTMMANLHTPEVPDTRIEEMLEEKTNTELEIQWVPDGNYVEKLNTAFATGSLPQAVFMKNQTTYLQFKEAIRNDQFWEIGPYLDEFENLKNLKEQVVKNTMVDGKVYALYQGRPLSRQGLIYRKDWADKLGLSAPKTTDELYNMLKAFTENDPDGDGKDDTIGLTDRSDLVYGSFKTVASYFGTPNYWGFKDGQLLPEFMFEEYMDTLDFYRKLHENGYINQDFPVTSKKDQQEMFKNGTAGVYIGSMGDVQSLYRDAAKINPDVVMDVHNYVEGPHGEFGVWSIPGFGNLVLFPKSAVETEEELKKILGFFDQLMTPEISNLIYWGVEGEHYEVVDGKAKPIGDAEVRDREVKPYQSIEIGEAATNGRYEGHFSLPAKAKSEELFKENEKYLINDPTVTLDSETYVEQGVRLQQIINDATYQYILRQIDKEGFQEAVDKWRKQGGDKIIEEFNASYERIQNQ